MFHIETYRDHHLVIKAVGDDAWRGCIIEKHALTRLYPTSSDALAEARAMVDEFIAAGSLFGIVASHVSSSDRHVTRNS